MRICILLLVTSACSTRYQWVWSIEGQTRGAAVAPSSGYVAFFSDGMLEAVGLDQYSRWGIDGQRCEVVDAGVHSFANRPAVEVGLALCADGANLTRLQKKSHFKNDTVDGIIGVDGRVWSEGFVYVAPDRGGWKTTWTDTHGAELGTASHPCTDCELRGMAMDRDSGDVWLAFGTDLVALDPSGGALIGELPAEHVAFDVARRRLLVADGSSLTALEDDRIAWTKDLDDPIDALSAGGTTAEAAVLAGETITFLTDGEEIEVVEVPEEITDIAVADGGNTLAAWFRNGITVYSPGGG